MPLYTLSRSALALLLILHAHYANGSNNTTTVTPTISTSAQAGLTNSTTAPSTNRTGSDHVNQTSIIEGFIDTVLFFSSNTDRSNMASNLLNSLFYLGYFKTQAQKGIQELTERINKVFRAVIVKPHTNGATAAPTVGTSLAELEHRLASPELLGYDEMEYKFFTKDSIPDSKFGVRVRYNLTGNGTWQYTRHPIDELGYLWSEGGGVSMVCMEGRWYESRADAVPKRHTGPEKIPNECTHFSPVTVEALRFTNLFVSKDRGHNLKVINYHTTQFGFSYSNCEMVLESAGCVMRTPKLQEWLSFGFHNSSHQYPVLHILINNNLNNENCRIRACAIVNLPERKISEHKLKGVEISVGQTFSRVGRRLLDINEIPQKGFRNRHICNTRNQLLPYQKSLIHSIHRTVPGPKVSYCNGTVYTSMQLGELYGCYSVGTVSTHHQCPGLKHTKDNTTLRIENVNCTIDYHLKECSAGHYCFKLSMLGSGAVTVKSNKHQKVLQCNHECTITVPDTREDTVVTCPDGKSHRLLYNLVVHNCPLERYLGSNAFFVCRMSHHPNLVYALFFWLFGGCPFLYVLFTTLKYLMLLTAWTIIKIRRVSESGKGKCEFCSEYVATGPEWQRHEDCKIGCCPYCRSRFSISGLRSHVLTCLDKEKILQSDEDVMNRRFVCTSVKLLGKLICRLQKHAVRLSWMLVLTLLFLLATRPVQGLQDVELQKGLWQQEVEEVELCQQTCITKDGVCYCDFEQFAEEQGPVRRLLFDHPIKPGVYNSRKLGTRSNPVEIIHNVKTPWGIVDVTSTHRPSYSTSALQMSWSSSEETDDGKVVLSGRSSGILKLEPNSGLTWQIKSKHSKEERRVSVSVLDHTQLYNARFEYLTGDRTVGSWMHGTCTGVCPEKCGCTLRSCHHLEWLKSRNWHCNPLWCWGIDQGCTCCAIDIKDIYNDWVVSKWSLEYLGTEALVCVDFDSGERKCEVVNSATQFESGPYYFQISDVSNVQQKLPNEILIFHKIPKDNGPLDLMKHHYITSASNICKLQSCTHGSAGDSQIYDLDRLIGNDIDSEHFFKAQAGKERAHWMSWEGVTMDYHCNQGHWPDCVFAGVVEKNSESFANLLKVEQNYLDSFFFHTVNCRINGSTPALEIQARAKQGPGTLNTFVEVRELTLTSLRVEVTSLNFRIVSCSGCYGCVEGGHCTVVASMSGTPKLGLHFESTTEHVTVSQSSQILTENEPTTMEVRFFSMAKVGKICFRLKEFRLCKTCDRTREISCSFVDMKDPERVLLEHRGTLVSTTMDNCTSFLTCWASSIAGFGFGLGNILNYLGGSILKGILIYLLPAALVVLLIVYGPSILSLVCKYRRLKGISRRLRHKSNNTDGIISLKKALQEGGKEDDDLMNFFSKHK